MQIVEVVQLMPTLIIYLCKPLMYYLLSDISTIFHQGLTLIWMVHSHVYKALYLDSQRRIQST